MTFSEIKDVLDAAGVHPSKQLGQNFLCDANVARWIVDQLDPQPEDVVVEVGPGTGALTEHLVGRVKTVILVEYDARLAEYQTKKYAENKDVIVHHHDGARFDTRKLLPYGKVKLLGNLPYSSGGAIMRNFMKSPSPVSKAVLMLQKEFIERIISPPHKKSYGVLSLRMQSEWVSRPVKIVPPEAFHPRPVIDSTVMVCDPVAEDRFPIYDKRLFDELIRRGFAQRRKQLRKQLLDTAVWSEVAKKLGVSESTRAEELSVDQWIELTRCYDNHPLKDIAQKDDEVFDVVNEQDEVLRQATRKQVHSEGLMHRAVHILVFNKRKEVFLQKRSRLKDVCPGRWDSSAAGHLDTGESYEACAIRELGEELGIQSTEQEAVEVQEIARLTPSEQTGWEHVALFLNRHDGALRYPASEVEDGLWLGMEQLQLWIDTRPEDFAPGFLLSWQEFTSQFEARQSGKEESD